MAYYVGDIPSEDIVIEPARRGEPITLAPFNTLDTTVTLRDFTGAVIPSDFLVTFDTDAADDIDKVVLEWPTDDSLFQTAGLYTLAITLVGPTARERLAPVYFVAQDDDGWHTIDTAVEDWDEAPAKEPRIFQLLEMAKEQVLAYAPILAVGAPIPARYRSAQLMQARNLWNAAKVAPENGGVGEESFTVTIHPLDWVIEQVLRPKNPRPVVR